MYEKEIELFENNNNKEMQEDEYQNTKRVEHSGWSLLILMLKKNLLLFQRQKCLTLFLFLSPLLICLLILLWQYLVDQFTGFLIIDPPVKEILHHIPKCTTMDSLSCTTIGYFILGPSQQWIQNVMKRVAYTNQLQYDSDVKLLGTFTQPNQISDYLLQHMNQTQIAVVFCTDQWLLYEKQPQISIPCHFEKLDKQVVFYTILYNYTLLYRSPYLSDLKIAYPKDAYASSLKISLDNAILREFSNVEKEDDEEFLYISQQEFPTIPTRFMQGIDIVGNYGAFYFFAPYLLNFLVLINEMLQEKGKKLRQGLNIMGLSHTIYWLSWTITALILVIILTINLLICGIVFRMDFFLNTPLLILFILYITFGFSIALLAFFIVVICPDVKNGYTIAYGFILTAILMQMCFTQAGMSILFYRTDASNWVAVIRGFMSLYPAFKYSLIFADISIKSCRHYSLEEGRWVEGDGFTYEDLFKVNSGKVQLDKNVQYQSPCAMDNYYHLLIACLFYIMLTYYFDHILESNRGKSDSLLFCITKPFNKFFKNQPNPVSELQYQCHSKDSAQLEKERVIKNQNIFVDGLRILGLSKTYHKYPFNIISKDDVHALKDMYLEINSGECLALLGHNGAGKTTLIGLLTGMFKPSKGTAQILNYDLNDMDKIRQMLGVCPQFDILWNQLTAAEHLRMYATIKGLHQQEVELEVERRLKDVELYHVKDNQIQTYSGGMKRRVSLAISAIGNPKIIIMDEPTTGMDPRARRQVWKMIKNMKQNRVVILTTHAMEEADVLADRIAVMAEGQLKAIGTSLFLKNNYSDGYRVNIITDSVDECLSKIKLLLNQFKILDTSGGSILISIPFEYMQDLKSLFEVFEKNENELNITQKELRLLIKDWGLSHATLEEVFMKVTRCCE